MAMSSLNRPQCNPAPLAVCTKREQQPSQRREYHDRVQSSDRDALQQRFGTRFTKDAPQGKEVVDERTDDDSDSDWHVDGRHGADQESGTDKEEGERVQMK